MMFHEELKKLLLERGVSPTFVEEVMAEHEGVVAEYLREAEQHVKYAAAKCANAITGKNGMTEEEAIRETLLRC